MSGLFQEKQAELQAAVLRVEQLSLQLEDLRRGKLNGVPTALGGHVTGAAALELRKLYQELQVLHGTHTAPPRQAQYSHETMSRDSMHFLRRALPNLNQIF